MIICLNSYFFSGEICSSNFSRFERTVCLMLKIQRMSIPVISILKVVEDKSCKGCPESFQTRVAIAP